jgi:hypothetical protein
LLHVTLVENLLQCLCTLLKLSTCQLNKDASRKMRERVISLAKHYCSLQVLCIFESHAVLYRIVQIIKPSREIEGVFFIFVLFLFPNTTVMHRLRMLYKDSRQSSSKSGVVQPARVSSQEQEHCQQLPASQTIQYWLPSCLDASISGCL